MKLLITGGAGFIGSAVVRHLIDSTDHEVLVVDKLTYAGNLDSLAQVSNSPRYRFLHADICDTESMHGAFLEYMPDAVMHLAAESHVDRSIDGPAEFVRTNIVGTMSLLQAATAYWEGLPEERRSRFRFLHVSTDEVFGDLAENDPPFAETTRYAPSSPYSASKAGSDHLVRAWHRTYGLPTLIGNCSNNYGPYQFPEKLIPLMILNAMQGKSLPVYGDGQQVRDWLYVDDHADALLRVLVSGKPGETYNIGGHNQRSNLEVVSSICELLDELAPEKPVGIIRHAELVRYVTDRPGHDRRYAVDASKVGRELGWMPRHTFESGLRQTVLWYINNQTWWQRVLDGSYRIASTNGVSP